MTPEHQDPLSPAPTVRIAAGQATPARRQRGYASLTIGVILLFILSLMSIYLARSGILDLRTSANKARYAEALAMAERRLDVGLGWMTLSANRATLTPDTWVTCNTLAAPFSTLGATWRCLTQTSTYTTSTGNQTDTFVLSTPDDSSARGLVYYIAATGTSVDLSASAVVKQGVYFYTTTGDGLSSAPPMMGAGNIPLNGTFNVVANPNGGGPGVPVSVWSKLPISDPQGASVTCQMGEYLRDGNCGGAPMSYKDVKGPDIVDNDPSFPTDMFQFAFGIPTPNYGVLKAQATQVGNCDTLSTLKGIVWVTGECRITGSSNGSLTEPLVLVVESGDVTMNANSTFYGLLFAFDPAGNAGSITANGGAQFFGSMMSNDSLSMGININGTFDMVYTPAVIREITSPGNTLYKPMAKIPGSWADYL